MFDCGRMAFSAGDLKLSVRRVLQERGEPHSAFRRFRIVAKAVVMFSTFMARLRPSPFKAVPIRPV